MTELAPLMGQMRVDWTRLVGWRELQKVSKKDSESLMVTLLVQLSLWALKTVDSWAQMTKLESKMANPKEG